ncbi:hypothetical protein CEP52_005234 [Fusarium oligoseptatum]|uniref:Uncharacterized protein n=1 Tax=Fusarium oligoseptatum TaxID=2604345 RepID=A0A428TZK3_9HYPO|nr:hypothetical protein CEP52_005234 [Fusarium oligoseptatum]
MALSSDVALDITTASVCAALIIARLAYRVLFRCKLHPTCHRTWRIDDFYMTIAILPLIGRSACISLSFLLNHNHTYEPATEAEALAQGVSVDQLNHDRILSHKLLIPGRICYALFLWCLKLGLLAFLYALCWSLSMGKGCREYPLGFYCLDVYCRVDYNSDGMSPTIINVETSL